MTGRGRAVADNVGEARHQRKARVLINGADTRERGGKRDWADVCSENILLNALA